MSKARIVGVCLLRNEENFVAWALMNVADFCDEIIVLDNKSTDRSPHILDSIARRVDTVRVLKVDDAYDTHKFVERFVGRNVWVLGVDGDEIYDPVGLTRLRTRILAGEFDGCWRLWGHALHVLGVDWSSAKAFGYGQPEARSITKLYNFNAISAWPGPHQRLHGKSMKFRDGYSLSNVPQLWKNVPWTSSDFRCLHMCFVPRSPVGEVVNSRPNPSEMMKAQTFLNRVANALRLQQLLRRSRATYKERFYAQGPIRTVDIASFGRPSDWPDLTPGALAVEELLKGRPELAAGAAEEMPCAPGSEAPSRT